MAKHPRDPLDSRDREILRFLFNAKRAVSGYFIAARLNISAPSIRPRLEALQKAGYIRKFRVGKFRSWKNSRNPNRKITAASKILWVLDLSDDTVGYKGN
jgi:biotin operon repressor